MFVYRNLWIEIRLSLKTASCHRMLSLDKENTNGVAGRTKMVDTGPASCVPSAVAAQQQATPKNAARIMMTGNTTGKRRALGDVINTANRQAVGSLMGVTPKVERNSIAALKINGDTKSAASKRLVVATPKAADRVEDDLEPVERLVSFFKRVLSMCVSIIKTYQDSLDRNTIRSMTYFPTDV